jgi:hypothetical protein
MLLLMLNYRFRRYNLDKSYHHSITTVYILLLTGIQYIFASVRHCQLLLEFQTIVQYNTLQYNNIMLWANNFITINIQYDSFQEFRTTVQSNV